MKHTKEPWEAYAKLNIKSKKGEFVAACGMNGRPIEVSQANVERIVSCVNACTGLSNESLDGGVIKKLIKAESKSVSSPYTPVDCGDGIVVPVKKEPK